MEKKKISAIFVFIFLILIAIMDYPFIVQILNERKQSAVTIDYNEKMNDLSEAQKQQYLSEAIEYNHSLATGVTSDLKMPFSTSSEQNLVYNRILNMHEKGIMAVVEIPKIKASVPVYHGTSDEVLDIAAGHMEGSSLPVGGNSTHACIAGHRGLATKKLFTDLDQMAVGDIFYIQVLGEKLAYQVYKTEVVTPDTVSPLKIEKGKDLVTLITCTPYGVNTHRIYVHGNRIPLEGLEELDTGTALGRFLRAYWWIILTIILLAWMFILLYWFNQKTKTEKGEHG